MIDFNMPRTRFVYAETLYNQFCKVKEEYNELGFEMGDNLVHKDLDLIAHEAVDLLQATQTLLHMLQEKHGVDVQGVIEEVVAKNRERRYYGDGNE